MLTLAHDIVTLKFLVCMNERVHWLRSSVWVEFHIKKQKLRLKSRKGFTKGFFTQIPRINKHKSVWLKIALQMLTSQKPSFKDVFTCYIVCQKGRGVQLVGVEMSSFFPTNFIKGLCGLNQTRQLTSNTQYGKCTF